MMIKLTPCSALLKYQSTTEGRKEAERMTCRFEGGLLGGVGKEAKLIKKGVLFRASDLQTV